MVGNEPAGKRHRLCPALASVSHNGGCGGGGNRGINFLHVVEYFLPNRHPHESLHLNCSPRKPFPHGSSRPPGPASAGHIVFVSDQSVILPGRNKTFQFIVKVEGSSGQVLHVPVQWSLRDSPVATVSSDGLATATADTGSATILVSAPAARAQPEAAQVTVASPAPGTLIIPSTEVRAETSTSATLPSNKQTVAIKPGQILVSGSRSGLLARVTAVSVGAGTVTVTTVPASLARAFLRLSIQAESAAVPTRLPAAELHRDHCRPSFGHGIHMSVADPSASVEAQVRLVANLQISHHAVDNFELAVQATVPVTIRSGAITVSAAGHASVTCELTAPAINVPATVFLGPVAIDGQVTASAGVTTTVGAGAAMAFSGPTVSYTMRATAGIQYTLSGGWQAVKSTPTWSTLPQVTPASQSFKASLTANAEADLKVGFGISAAFGDCAVGPCTSLATVGLAFTTDKANWGFRIQPPFLYTTAGYQGPEWAAGLHLTAGPELTVTGGIAELFTWIGVSAPSRHWNTFDRRLRLGGSPALTVSARAPAVAGGAISLTASLPPGFSGDTVRFIAYPASGGPGFVVVSTTVIGSSARATWQPATHQSGTFRIAALLFDPIFGSSRLPYASASAPVTVATISGLTP